MVGSLGLSVPPQQLNHADGAVAVRAVMSAWLPLARSLLGAVAAHLPSSRAAQAARLPSLCPSLAAQPRTGRVRAAIEACDASESAPLVLYVAKMVYAVGVPGAHEADEFVGFARLFSGTLRPGSGGTVRLVAAAAGGGEGGEGGGEGGGGVVLPIDSLRLYLLMGRELVSAPQASAGSIIGVGGLAGAVRKRGTVDGGGADPHFPTSPQISSLTALDAGVHICREETRGTPSPHIASLLPYSRCSRTRTGFG